MRPISIAFLIVIMLSSSNQASAQLFSAFDSLRGSNGPNRALWNVLHYDLTLTPDFEQRTIKGFNRITFFDSGTRLMQIDLQQPMVIDSVLHSGNRLPYSRNGNVYTLMFIDTNSLYHYRVQPGVRSIDVYFSGKPKEAANAPWDGGWVWKKDPAGHPWASVACQGDGASVWYPCKDFMADKPDSGATLRIITPQHLVGIGNGKLIEKKALPGDKTQYSWQVKSPINTYNIIPYIGKYTSFRETFTGESGTLPIEYWVLEPHLNKARTHFKQVPHVLQSMEYWLGPYPFYEDGYKLVEAPYLGMEHQSNIAYGNAYMNGYLGSDLSNSGFGLLWDFIIVHETGHEWFGNSLTADDMADLWIHEGFTTYTEVLYTQSLSGKAAADSFMQGTLDRIENNSPVVGIYGVRNEGSSDMYPKGAALIHMMRLVIGDDELFRSTLRKMVSHFHHGYINTPALLNFWNTQTGKNFNKMFSQYLSTTQVPVLEWRKDKKWIYYRWTRCIDGFNMPVEVQTSCNRLVKLEPTTEWKKIACRNATLTAAGNYYIEIKRID